MKKFLIFVILIIIFTTCTGCKSKEIRTISNANVGDFITFGSYEQDNYASNGLEPIEWQVLSKENDKVLLLSRFCLEFKRFGDYGLGTAGNWEESEIREWLNDGFFNTAFNESEQKRIVKTNNEFFIDGLFEMMSYGYSNHYNEYYDKFSCKDKVFLLGAIELYKYNLPIRTTPTNYAAAQNRDKIYEEQYNDEDIGDSCAWYLRSQAIMLGDEYYDPNEKAYGVRGLDIQAVNELGEIVFTSGNGYYGIRPAIYVDIS